MDGLRVRVTFCWSPASPQRSIQLNASSIPRCNDRKALECRNQATVLERRIENIRAGAPAPVQGAIDLLEVTNRHSESCRLSARFGSPTMRFCNFFSQDSFMFLGARRCYDLRQRRALARLIDAISSAFLLARSVLGCSAASLRAAPSSRTCLLWPQRKVREHRQMVRGHQSSPVTMESRIVYSQVVVHVHVVQV